MANRDGWSGAQPMRWVAILLFAALAPCAFTGHAKAQWGYGFDPGWMVWQPNYTPESVNYLNQRAAIAGQAAASSRPQNLTAPARPPRDVTFFERYDAETRRRMEEGIARRPTLTPGRLTPRPAPTPAPAPVATQTPARPTPVIPLNTFFNRYDQLVWPTDAPMEGDLATKRSTSDKASLVVLKELTSRGVATIGSATEARSKLLDYGRPALEAIRKVSTTPVSDAFHLFLLSLYESLGQAVDPPKTDAKPKS